MTQIFKPVSCLDTAKSVIIYGKGNVGRDVLKIALERGWEVRCILDQKAQPGERISSIPVFHPNSHKLTTLELDIPLIISIFNRDVDIYALADRLNALGFINLISFWDFHAQFPTRLGDRFWLTDRKFYSPSQSEIEKVGLLWADESSRLLFDDIIRSRLDGNLYQVDRHIDNTKVQYLPFDIPNWRPENSLRFIDCGAFDGDTIQTFYDQNQHLEAIAAFEPDLENFNKLVERVNRLSRSSHTSIMLWPSAVGDHVTYVHFNSGNGEGSKVNPSDIGDPILCITLDATLSGFKPNLIKMDIEGSEPEALLGAYNIIQTNLPRLAICVYHLADHVWKIPLLVHNISNKYKLYLRVYSFNGFDVVMYAIPFTERDY